MNAEILLISDLDDTLLGDREALRRFSEWFATVRGRMTLVYASGRFFDSVKNDIQQTPLPEPIAVIGGVGSEIRTFPDGEMDSTWAEQMSGAWSADDVRQLLAQEESLELQPEECQSDFKVSYFLREATEQQIDRLRTTLLDGGIDANLIYSSKRDLDVLPQGVNKGTAAAFVARQLHFDRDRVIVAGNSGNDTTLFEHEFYGIIVANAHDELKQLAGRRRVYLSPRARADGVWDGLEHWMRELAIGR